MSRTDYVPVAIEAARYAGATLLQFRERGVTPEYKGKADVVTAADRAAEEIVISRLRDAFPEHSIVGEEGGGIDQGSEFTWYVDPLDGTTNFAHGFPVFAVSIGLERNGEGVAGVVYDPSRDELFAAERGAGAFLNGRPIRVSEIDFENGLYSTGFPPSTRTNNPNVYNFFQFSVLTHGARRAGSAALDICSVAAGRMEGFWEIGLKSWDVSGGTVIAVEAGGRCTAMDGGPYRSGDPRYVISNGIVHEEMLAVFRETDAGRLRAPLPKLPS